jgi:hypothetical protein
LLIYGIVYTLIYLLLIYGIVYSLIYLLLAHLAKLLPSLGIRCPLTFHILIFSSETPQSNELKLGRKHLWKVLYKDCFRGEDFKKLANQKQELPVVAMFVNGLGQNEQSL